MADKEDDWLAGGRNYRWCWWGANVLKMYWKKKEIHEIKLHSGQWRWLAGN